MFRSRKSMQIGALADMMPVFDVMEKSLLFYLQMMTR